MSHTNSVIRFRQWQQLISRAGVWHDPGAVILIVIALASNLGNVILAQVTGSWEVTIALLVIQSAMVPVFIKTEKYDRIISHGLVMTYVIYYTVVMAYGDNLYPIVAIHAMSFPAFAFVARGNLEGLLWSVALVTLVSFGLFLEADSTNYQALEIENIITYFSTATIVVFFTYVIDTVGRRYSQMLIQERDQTLQSEAKFNVLLNSIGDGLVAVDKHGKIDFVNQTASEILGHKPDHFIGKHIESAIILTDLEEKIIKTKGYPVSKVLRSSRPFVSNQATKDRYLAQHNDGSTFPVSLIISPVLSKRKLTGAIMLFSDSTDIDDMDKAKSEFVSLASHQLRTPLNVISWYAEKLGAQKKGKLNPKQTDYVKEIYENNMRLINMVSDLLNVSRIDLGRLVMKHEDVNISELAKRLTHEIKPLAGQKKIKLDFEAPKTKLVFTDSDISYMTLIIQNLLSNAVKYTKEKGRVSLKIKTIKKRSVLPNAHGAKTKGDGVLLSVSDNGLGIPLKQQEKIFTKLFRAENVNKLDVEGTGLGLYITQSFVHRLDGEIWFKSTLNKGTTFYVFIPFVNKNKAGT